MGTSSIIAERTATDIDLTLSVSRNGGVAGLTAVVAIRDGDTPNSYLDFADQTFKTSGWTTRQAAMTDLGGGHYRRALDLTAMINLPAGTEELVAEYETTGSVASVTHDKIQIVTSFLTLATAAALATVQADTDDIQTRLPAALVAGRMDADVGAIQAGAIDAAAVATDAIDADALATDAIAEIAGYLETTGTNPHGTGAWDATATVPPQTIRDAMKLAPTAGAPAVGSVDAHLDTIEADTDDIQTRIPAALVGGRMDSDVGAIQAGAITPAAIATDAIDADALATDAIAEIAGYLETTGPNPHGTGAWTGSVLTTQQIRDSMKLAPTGGAPAAGSVDEALDNIEADTAAGGPGPWTTATVPPQTIRDAMKLAPTVGAPAAGSVDEHLDTISADADDIQTRIPAALVGGRMDSSVGAVVAGAITALAIATDAIDADALSADAIAEIVAALNDLSSADVQAALTAQGYTVGRAPKLDNLDQGLAATELNIRGADGDDLKTLSDQIDAIPAAPTPPTVAAIADGVWDEPTAGHQGAGTFGRAANAVAAEATVAAAPGPTAAVFGTTLTQADGFWVNMLVVVVNSAGEAVARNVNAYTQANGLITVDALPFTPVLGDAVIIMRRQGGVNVNAEVVASNVGP